jgi:hypothetical protein
MLNLMLSTQSISSPLMNTYLLNNEYASISEKVGIKYVTVSFVT